MEWSGWNVNGVMAWTCPERWTTAERNFRPHWTCPERWTTAERNFRPHGTNGWLGAPTDFMNSTGVLCPIEPRAPHNCTKRRRNAHRTEEREVLYPWHPGPGASSSSREYADCAQFLQRVAEAESAGNSTLDVPVTAGSSPQALRLALDLSFGGGPVDSHHIRASVQTAISQFVAEGAITPDDEAHAALENWSVSIVPAEEA